MHGQHKNNLLQIKHGNLRSSSGGYFLHAAIQHICSIFCIRESCWGDSKIFLECSKMMIRFPCQKVVILEGFTDTYFQKSPTIHNFKESCAPILFFKNKKIHWSSTQKFYITFIHYLYNGGFNLFSAVDSHGGLFSLFIISKTIGLPNHLKQKMALVFYQKCHLRNNFLKGQTCSSNFLFFQYSYVHC